MDSPTSANLEEGPAQEKVASKEAVAHLNELVLDHLGIPRPGAGKQIQVLQDELLPRFMETARFAWVAASPYQMPRTADGGDAILSYLHKATETAPGDIVTLNQAMEDLGVPELLDDVAASPYASELGQITVDPYDTRLLKAAGHPTPQAAVLEYLGQVAKTPNLMAEFGEMLEQAGRASLKAHSAITNINLNINFNPPVAGMPKVKKPKRGKLFAGLGALFSGLVLMTGNSILCIAIPTSADPVAIVGSLAAGIGAVGNGVGTLLEEDEEMPPAQPQPGQDTRKANGATRPTLTA